MALSTPPAAASPGPAPCHAARLRLSTDGQDGAFDGMSHSGVELSIRNLGPDCTLPALPKVVLLSRAGRPLQAVRQAPLGLHPGPVMVPVFVGAGHRAASDLRWVSGPVYDRSRSVRAASVMVRIGGAVLRTPLKALLYGPAGKPVTFEQPPLRAMEGMPAG